ncbi:MAG: DUF2953 domain-containing protein [Eubacterium sp.]|nr:DUF2953 domain-containing protein [Eubacterium sp.]
MLHIVLLILKIIGIIIGVLLGLILLGICLALFVPIRYRIDAKRVEGEENPPVEVSAKITWLLHIINIRAGYSTQLWARVRIFILTVFRLPKKEKAHKKTKKHRTRKTDAPCENVKGQESDTRTEAAQEQKTAASRESGDEQSTGAPQETGAKRETGGGQTADAAESEMPQKPPKISMKARISGWIAKICGIFQNIWYTIKGICDKIKKIRENIEYYCNVLQSETFKQSYSVCKEELIHIFSYIKPRKFQADLVIGTGAPASTADILAYYGMLYPLIGGNVNITPDFDEKRAEGDIHIKGKIKLFTFIRAAVRIYFNKDIRKLLKLFKKEDA